MLDGSRDELGRNSDKAGLRRRNMKDAAMPELIGSSDNLWEYLNSLERVKKRESVALFSQCADLIWGLLSGSGRRRIRERTKERSRNKRSSQKG